MKKIVLLMSFLATQMVSASGDSNIRLTALIEGERAAVTLIAENRQGWYHRLCSGLKVRVRLEDPETLLEQSLVVDEINDIYLYPQEDERVYENYLLNEEINKLRERTGRDLVVKSVELDESSLECRSAGFFDYCKYAQKDRYERLSLSQLAYSYKDEINNCQSLSVKVAEDRWIDLEHRAITDFRFLRFMPRARRLYLEGTYNDRSGTLQNGVSMRVYDRDQQLEIPAGLEFEWLLGTLTNDERSFHEEFVF